jgi:hypothetical protein
MTTSIKHLIITAGFVTRARGVAERPASLAPSAAQNGVAVANSCEHRQQSR